MLLPSAALRLSSMLFLGAIALLALLWTPAAAQTPSPLAEWQYSVGEVLIKQVGPVPEWRVALGGGAEMEPLYEGSKRYVAEPSVVFDIRWRDIAFISDGEGMGVNLLRGKNYRAGIALDYDLGRDHHLQHRLAGLGNVDPAPEAKIFGEYFLLPVVLSVDLRKGLGGHNGLIGDTGAYIPLPLAPNAFLFTGPSVTFADARYMNAYFGVSPAQASRSEFTPYSPNGGLDRAGWGATAVWSFASHWWLEGAGAVQYLMGGAGHSPIVEDRAEFTANVNVLYTF